MRRDKPISEKSRDESERVPAGELPASRGGDAMKPSAEDDPNQDNELCTTMASAKLP